MADESFPSGDGGANFLIQCSICFEQFAKNRVPRVLPCTHVYCSLCITKIAKAKKGIIECPECRQNFGVPVGGVEKFPPCRTTKRLLEHYNTRRLQKATESETRKSDTSAQQRSSHGSMSTESQELLSTLRVSIQSVTQSSEKLYGDTIDKIRSERAVLSETLEGTKKEIMSSMADIKKAATQRKRELMDELNKAHEESLALLNAQEDEYKREKEVYEGFCSEMSKTLEGYRKDGRAPREDLERLIQEAQSKDSSLQHIVHVSSKRLSFKGVNDKNILSEILSWGNLQREHYILEVHPIQPVMGSKLTMSTLDQEGLSHYVDKEGAVYTLGHEPGIMLPSPCCAAELPNGDIAVASSMSYDIRIFASRQQKRLIHLAVPPGGSFSNGITGMCMNPMGKLCVSNPDMHAVQVLSLDGKKQYSFKVQNTSRNEEFTPWGMACNPRGELFVCDWANHLIRVFDSSGKEVRQFGGRGKEAGKFNRPSDVALLPDGEVAVADYNNDRIQVFDGNTGVFQSTFGTPGCAPNQLKGPMGIAVDSKGVIAVSECLNNRVQLFTLRGKSFKILGTQGEGQNQFNTPRGITISRKNEIVVCDSKNDRVQIF